jgi:GT2 family glycosyltransferase
MPERIPGVPAFSAHPLPRVSVVMPAYNAERYIDEAIRSVLSQTMPDWELIVVDDGSTDRTRAIAESFTDPRVRVIPLPHGGSPSRSRNAGIRAARARNVAFLDADDRFYDGALETLLGPMEARPELIACFGFQHRMDEVGRPIGPAPELVPLRGGGWRLSPRFQLGWPMVYRFHVTFAPSALVARREALDAIGGFDEGTLANEDFKLYVQLFQLGLDRIQVIPACVYWYRIAAGTLTHNRARALEVIDSEVRVVEWLYAQPTTTPQLARLRPQAYALKYVTFARMWYRTGDAPFARSLLRRAREQGKLTGLSWWRHLGVFWARTWLPVGVDDQVARLYRSLRGLLDGAPQR